MLLLLARVVRISSTGFKFGSSTTSTAKKDDTNGVFNFGGSKSSSKLDTLKNVWPSNQKVEMVVRNRNQR